jgi:AP2 domain/HNH endonuclease
MEIPPDIENEIRVIHLTRDQVTIVDRDDFEWLNQWKWQAEFCPNTSGFYAVRGIKDEAGKPGTARMHRLIIGAQPGQIVDHVDRNSLNNTRANLRIVTAEQNSVNCRLLKRHNTSGFRGVSWDKRDKLWRAALSVNRRTIYLGGFKTPEAAAAAYDAAAKKQHGGFSPLNFAPR